jgi:leader peptidase (prepilin peptidase)/N-methyltransferase
MLIAATAFIFGLLFGSFLNVCIARLPREESIVWPASRCPKCLTPIKFYDNIPLVSFLALRGRCRACKEPISLKYPAVELFTGLATALFAAKWHANPGWAAAAILSAYVLIVISVVDFETMLISDAFSLALFLLGLAGSYFNPYFSGGWLERLGSALGGAAAGAGFIWGLAALGKAIYKKDAVGEGDIFLMGAIGALGGWQGVLSGVVMASFFGSVYGIALIVSKRADRMSHMPFGPFLAAGAMINLYSMVRPDFFFVTLPF